MTSDKHAAPQPAEAARALVAKWRQAWAGSYMTGQPDIDGVTAPTNSKPPSPPPGARGRMIALAKRLVA